MHQGRPLFSLVNGGQEEGFGFFVSVCEVHNQRRSHRFGRLIPLKVSIT